MYPAKKPIFQYFLKKTLMFARYHYGMLGKEQQNPIQPTSQAQGSAADSSAHEKVSPATEVTQKENQPSIKSLGVVESSANITELEEKFFNLFDILLLSSIELQESQNALTNIRKLFFSSIEGPYTNEELITLYCRLLELTFRQLISFDDFILPLPDYISVRIRFQLLLLESLIYISRELLEHLIHHKDDNHHQHCRQVFAWLDWLLRSVAGQTVHLLYSDYNTAKLIEYGGLSVKTFNIYRQLLVEQLVEENKAHDEVLTIQLVALDVVISNCYILLFNEIEVLCSISNQVFSEKFKKAQQQKIADFLENKKILTAEGVKFEFIFSEKAIKSLNADKLHNFSDVVALEDKAHLITILNKEFGFSIVFAEFHKGMEDELKKVKEKIIQTREELDKSNFFHGWYGAACAANGNHFDMAAGKFFDQLVNANNTLTGTHPSKTYLLKIPGTNFKKLSFSQFYDFQLLFLYSSLFICYALLSGVENLNKAMEDLYLKFMKTYTIMSTTCLVQVIFSAEIQEQLKAREEVEKVVKLMGILYGKSKAVLKAKTIQDKKRYAIEEKKMFEEQKGKKAQNKKKKKKNRKKKEKPEKAEDDLTDSSDTESETHSLAAAEQTDESNRVAMTQLEAAEKKLNEACSAIFQIKKDQVFTYEALAQMKQCCKEVRLILESLSLPTFRENPPWLEKKTSLQHSVDTILDLITIAASKNIEDLLRRFDIKKTEESSKLLLQVEEACQLVSMDNTQGDYLRRVDRLQAELDLRIQGEKRRVHEQEELMRQKREKEERIKREAEERRHKEELEKQKKEADRLKREAEEKQRQEEERLKREEEKKRKQEEVERLKREEEKKRQETERLKQEEEKYRQEAETAEKLKQKNTIKYERQEEIASALKAFFGTYPGCRDFILINNLCLTGGAILDIYYVWKLFSTDAERQFYWSRLIADLDCIAPASCDFTYLSKMLYDPNIIGSSTTCPAVLKGYIETFEVDIRKGGFQIAEKEKVEHDLIKTDLTTSAIGVFLSAADGRTEIHFFDPANGIEDIFSRQIKFIGSAEEKILADPTRLFRLIRLIGKFAIYEAQKKKCYLQDVFAAPNYTVDPAIMIQLSKIIKNLSSSSAKTYLTPARLTQLLFKSFLHQNAWLHYEVGMRMDIFTAFFASIYIPPGFEFLERFFCYDINHEFFREEMYFIDTIQDKNQKMIYFVSMLMRCMVVAMNGKLDAQKVTQFLMPMANIIVVMRENKTRVNQFHEKRLEVIEEILLAIQPSDEYPDIPKDLFNIFFPVSIQSLSQFNWQQSQSSLCSRQTDSPAGLVNNM